jgi:hypothetical protein
MKKNNFIMLLLISFIAVSCGDDKDESPAPIVEDTSVYFTCKFNGVNYTDDARFADYISGRSRVVSQNNEELVLLEMSKDTTGSFIINATNPNNNISYIDSLNNTYTSISGTIVVTEFSKSKQIITGTFSGVMVNDLNVNDRIIVTEGKFNRVKLEPF